MTLVTGDPNDETLSPINESHTREPTIILSQGGTYPLFGATKHPAVRLVIPDITFCRQLFYESIFDSSHHRSFPKVDVSLAQELLVPRVV